MRPFILLKYFASGVWIHDGRPATQCGPQLENDTAAAAYDVHVSDLVLNRETSYRFGEIEKLLPHEVVALERLSCPPANSFTKAISRDIVNRVLVGQSLVTRWPLRVTYRSESGGVYSTCYEIRIVRLPLEIGCRLIPGRNNFTDDVRA